MSENWKQELLGLTLTSGEAMPSDIEIAQQAKMMRIADVARDKLGISDEHLEPYGHYKAKVSLPYLDTLKDKPNGKLIWLPPSTPLPLVKEKRQLPLDLVMLLITWVKKQSFACVNHPLGQYLE